MELGEAESAASLAINPLPNSLGARWHIAADGKAIELARPTDEPLLTLRCKIAANTAPQLTVIRHAGSEPGAKALFAVIGNGIISRIKLDATLAEKGWRWEGTYRADAAALDAFTGPRDIEATLPGAGTLRIDGSTLPREFIGWCRRNGETLPGSEAVSSPSPAPSGSTA